MSEKPGLGPPPKDGSLFRAAIGLLAVLGALAGFAALYMVAVPTSNRDALMLALGVVLGWGSSVINSEYGATTTGRKVAEHAIKKMEEDR